MTSQTKLTANHHNYYLKVCYDAAYEKLLIYYQLIPYLEAILYQRQSVIKPLPFVPFPKMVARSGRATLLVVPDMFLLDTCGNAE